MIETLQKELVAKGVLHSSEGEYIIDGKKMSYDDAVRFFLLRSKENKTLLLTLWSELSQILRKPGLGEYSERMCDIFLYALKHLYNLASLFPKLQNNGTTAVLYSALCRDISDFPSHIMKMVISYNLGIEWSHHLIMRDLYVLSLLRKHKALGLGGLRVTTASGSSGPWANLDLPMKERFYGWDEIDDEMTGRTKQRQQQSRYNMGIEDYHSPRVKEGFYWEEVRRFPYSFDDEDENIYPHRNLLWKS